VSVAPTLLSHGRIRLALHSLRDGPGRPLLLLHGLGERAPETVPEDVDGWPGPIQALDFTGHGASTVPRGGGYSPEILMADADTALARQGEATVLGRGLGAYVALLLAGARPQQVRGAVLCDGPGLAGGGATFAEVELPLTPPETTVSSPDPFALLELSSDVRPPDYARLFVRLARHLSGLECPMTVCAAERPPWLEAVATAPGVAEGSVAEALERYLGEAKTGP